VDDAGDVKVQVQAAAGDVEDLDMVTDLLREELLELDVTAVDRVDAEAPADAKGLSALAGWLVVHLGTGAALKSVIDAIRGWAARTHREVEVTWGGDVLKVSGISSAQQTEIIDVWLSRHSGSA
jgi:hypothetical protein